MRTVGLQIKPKPKQKSQPKPQDDKSQPKKE